MASLTSPKAATEAFPDDGGTKRAHPIRSLVLHRSLLGLGTIFAVSIIVFMATQVLPGNAATAILGNTASPEQVAALEEALNLNEPPLTQYWTWISGVATGDPGTSLANGEPVWPQVWPRLVNSAVLGMVAAFIGVAAGVSLGIVVAWKRGRPLDHGVSVTALVVTSLPEFVVAMALILTFATGRFKVLPPVSNLPPGTYAWQEPIALVLPAATLALIITPYILRMTRAAMIEALDSDYVEMARLKGLSERRVLMTHSLRNALPPIIQVVGLCLLYLAGGVVIVETVFAYPGIGQGLVIAVTARDIPVIQLLVLMLATFYVIVNITTDAVTLVATPRRRFPR